MNLRDLEYLVAVADHRHFGRAAASCHVTQPTLSTQIRKLEEHLGVQLVERSPRHVALTRAGEQVVERARIVLAEVATIVDIGRNLSVPTAATIRLGMFPTLGPYLLPHVGPGIRRRFPELQLLLSESRTEDIVDQLGAGRLDAGVLALPIPDPELDHEVLFEEDFVLAVPADHPLAADPAVPVPTSVLADEDVLLLEDGHCLRDQALAVCQLVGAEERRDFPSTSLETMRQLVAAGVGVTLLPRLAVEPPVPTSDGVVLRPFADPVPHRTLALFWRRTSAYREFLPQLAAALRDLPDDLVPPTD